MEKGLDNIVIAEHIGNVKYSVLKNAIKIFVRSFHMQIHAKGQVRTYGRGSRTWKCSPGVIYTFR